MTGKGEQARDAIDALFSDTSVGRNVTLDDLQELASDIEMKIEAIKCDIKNEEKA